MKADQTAYTQKNLVTDLQREVHGRIYMKDNMACLTPHSFN